MKVVRAYSNLSAKKPIQTAIVSTTVLSFVGDIITQNIEHKYINKSSFSSFNWNYKRSIKFGIVGCFLGPQLSLWYKYLSTSIFPGETFIIAIKRMIIDQSLFAPYATAYFLTFSTLLDTGNINDIKNRLKSSWFKAYKVNLTVWPAAQIINFCWIPLQYRVLWANLIALWWNSYLSFVSHT